jgi:hypothetical protein
MKIKKEELIKIAPHIFYGYKCGMYVKHSGLDYMFMGYVDKNQCTLSDIHGNKFIAFLCDVK